MDVALVYDRGATGQPDAYVFGGRFDARPDHPTGPGFLTKWCEVRLPKAPGARVTIARVWRGNVAIPSREGVTITWADKSGRVRCPRIVGEASAPLRMHVEPKNGKPFFQMLDLDARSGAVNFDGFRGRVRIDAKGVVTPLGAGPINTGSPRARSLALLEWLRQKAASVPRTDTGTSRLELVVETDTATPLSAWLAVLRVAAHPDVLLRRLELNVIPARAERRDAGRTITYKLPKDTGLSGATLPRRTPVRFFIEGEALGQRVTLRKPDHRLLVPPQTKEKEFIKELRKVLKARTGDDLDAPLHIVPLASTDSITMRVVALVLEGLAGARNIGFEDRP